MEDLRVRIETGGVDTVVEVSPVANDFGGYSIMQAESKEALAATMKDHPHFTMIGDATIEIVEVMPIPGM